MTIEEKKEKKINEKFIEISKNLENFDFSIKGNSDGMKEYIFKFGRIALNGISNKESPKCFVLRIDGGEAFREIYKDSTEGVGIIYEKIMEILEEKLIIEKMSKKEKALFETDFTKKHQELSCREIMILEMLYGVRVDRIYTLEETATQFSVLPKRIEEIKFKALEKCHILGESSEEKILRIKNYLTSLTR